MPALTTIDDLLEGVVRLLDQHPDVRARVGFIELLRDNNGAVIPSDGLTVPMPRGTDGGIVVPEFNFEGHAVIAYVAERYLDLTNPTAFQALQAVKGNDPLGRGDIGQFATWPDRLKREPGLASQRQRLGGGRNHWHYINIPYDPEHPNQHHDLATVSGDLLKQLPGQLALLSNPDPTKAADGLCFVLHLVGDLHQPLHCVALADDEYFTTPPEYDQGGNLVRWGADRARGNNLHSLWDGAIAANGANVANRVDQVMQDHPVNSFSASQLKLSAEKIALESYSLAKKAYKDFFDVVTYQGPSTTANGGQQFSSPPPQYAAHAREVCRERAALGGYRLARLLVEHLAGPGAHTNGHSNGRTNGRRGGTRRRTRRSGGGN